MQLFLVLSLVGLGSGAIIASLTLGLVVTFKGTGVVNFAQGAIAMWGAYVYNELTTTGKLVFPWAGVPNSVSFGHPIGKYWALAAGVLSAMALGALIYLLVMRRMRHAPVLGQVVATIGIMLVIQGLAVLQFGTGVTQNVLPILPSQSFAIGAVSTSVDRIVLAVMALVVTGFVWSWFRFSRTGLACRASAESEKGTLLIGLSNGRLALITWTLSSALAGLFGALVAPLLPLSADVYPLLVVPALAAALVGRLSNLWVATVAALVIGVLQASVQFFLAKGWLPIWAQNGLPQAIPLVLIVVALIAFGAKLPGRSGIVLAKLSPARIPRRPGRWILLLVVVGVVCVLTFSANYRLALIVSVATMTITLSQVVLTGFVGQISFAQAAIAGTAAFALSKLTSTVGLPFPVGPILAVLIATAFGVAIGLPALRIRGSQLAVVTIAAASAIEVSVFQNAAILDSQGLAPVNPPKPFGYSLSPFGPGFPRPGFCIVVVLGVGLLFYLVARVLMGAAGRRFLAVRSDEVAATTVGVDVIRVKLFAFTVSSLCAALGGVVFAQLRGSVSADDFVVFVGLSYLAVTYIGAIGTLAGAVIGGLAVNSGLLTVSLNHFVNLGSWYLLLTGVFLVISAMDNPEGVAIRFAALAQSARRRLGLTSSPFRPDEFGETGPDAGTSSHTDRFVKEAADAE